MENQARSRRVWRGFVVVGLLAVVFIACNSDRRIVGMLGDAMVDAGRVISDAASQDAMAQEPACMQWEVKSVVIASAERVRFSIVGDPDSIPSGFRYDPLAMEPGWEPYAAGDGTIYVRHCVTP